MTPGLRTYKQASCRVSMALGLPEEMQPVTREIIDVQSQAQGNGDATALMHTVCAEADRHWITLIVQVRPFADGLTMDQLKRFYEKHGFAEFQAEPCLMARSPEKPRIIQ